MNQTNIEDQKLNDIQHFKLLLGDQIGNLVFLSVKLIAGLITRKEYLPLSPDLFWSIDDTRIVAKLKHS